MNWGGDLVNDAAEECGAGAGQQEGQGVGPPLVAQQQTRALAQPASGLEDKPVG